MTLISMKNTLKKINDLKLRTKLIISFVIVVIIPIMIAGIYLTYQLRQIALNDSIMKNTEDNVRFSKRINEFLQVPINLSNQFLEDNRLETFATTQYKTKWQYVKAYQDYTMFNDYLKLTDYISNIRFYIDNPSMIDNWRVIQPDLVTKKYNWYQETVAKKGLIGWYYTSDFTKKNHQFLTLVRQINFLQHHSYGVLAIDVNTAYINSILNEVSSPTMIIVNNEVIASNNFNFIGNSLDDLNIPRASISKDGIVDSVINGKKYKVITSTLTPETSYTNFKIVTFIPIKEIMRKANHASLLGLAVIFISILVASILIYFFSNFLSKRMSNFSLQINEVTKGNFNTKVNIEGNDEIGQIADQFNYMVDSIKQLMVEVKEAEQQKNALIIKEKEIKFKMLASQINPHFLFNVLESIRMKAHLNGDKEIGQVVKKLGKLMRHSLEVGSGFTTLKNEINNVESYLEIQKFRFGNRFEYLIKMTPKSDKIRIPPFTIQPLVENAVIHGLENVENNGLVEVNIHEDQHILQISVSDNGIGIPESQLKMIKEHMDDTTIDDGQHIGLINVHQRLKLTYGEEYGLHITSSVSKGTNIHFSIPIGGIENV